MRVLFLGTGTSHGVPMIACDCGVCRSSDVRDKRFRPSIYITMPDGLAVLVDATPDLRSQALAHDVRRVDAILLTHAHADHIMGLDEVRRFNYMTRRPMPVYADAHTIANVRQVFGYAFDAEAKSGGGVPSMDLVGVEGPFDVGGCRIVPVPVMHGRWQILGFRFGGFAYLTDCNGIPDASFDLLGGLDVLVIDALRRRPHPTHFTLDEAIAAARRIGAVSTYFTHIAHDLGHEATSAALPPGMGLAYDGLTLDVG